MKRIIPELLRKLATRKDHLEKGFTLVELMVVVVIVSLSFMLLTSARRSVSLNETVNLVVADLKNAHFMAVSSAMHNNAIRCGYGIADVATNRTEYFIYAGPQHGSPLSSPAGATVDCATQNRHYCGTPLVFPRTVPCNSISKQDEILGPIRKLFSADFEFKSEYPGEPNINFFDIFFEPPEPKVFVCRPTNSCVSSDAALTVNPAILTIGRIGQTCAQSPCKSICVYTSGRIEVAAGATCP